MFDGRSRTKSDRVEPIDSYMGTVEGDNFIPIHQLTNWGAHETLYESILDIKERFSKDGRYPDHPVRHFRCKGGMLQMDDYKVRSTARPDLLYYSTVGYRPKITYAGGMPSYDTVPVVPVPLLDELAYNAMRRFADDIQQQASLLNFLYELKDFKNLLGPIRGLISRLFTDWSNKPGLTWEFAMKPFIEDVMKIVGSFKYVKKRIEFLKKFNGQTTDVSYTSDSVPDRMGWSPQSPIDSEFGPDWDPKQAKGYVTAFKCTFRAHAKIRINAKFLDSLSREVDAYASALGIGSLFDWLKAGYKAFPFSWLIDFFFKTNRLLDKLDVSQFSDLGSSPIEVLTTTWSLKKVVDFDYYSKLPDSGAFVRAGRYSFLEYSRDPGLPFDTDGNSWLRFQSLLSNRDMLLILVQILLPGFNDLTRKGRKKRKLLV